MSRLGTPEVLIIALLIIVFFGSKKLPEFIKSIGLSIKEFKNAMQEK